MTVQRRPIALTIAGSDSGGCAGIQADLRTFAALGVHGASVITAVTAQNTRGVEAFEPVSPRLIALQIDAVLEDIGADGVKTGMLATPESIEVVAERLAAWKITNLVLDPVMVATSGDRLMHKESLGILKERLLPLASLITPNLQEAGILLGRTLRSREEILSAGPALRELGAAAVLIKGGHLSEDSQARDFLFVDGAPVELTAVRIPTRHTHGSGCSLAAAIAAWIARGLPLQDAVVRAKEFITAAIAHGYAIGAGPGPLGHLHEWWRRLDAGSETFTAKTTKKR